jgi:hypothetical protein
MSDLVVASLIGGLGNQLFQFAAAKGLQQRADDPVVVDTRMSMEWPNRLPSVLRDGSFREVTQRELLRLRQVPHVRKGQRTLMRLRVATTRRLPWLRLDGLEFREESPIAFDAAILDFRPPVLLRGHLQSETYFGKVADAVRGSFRPAPLDAIKRYRDIERKLPQGRPLVGISLRTGADYRGFGLVLPYSYYERALDLIMARVGQSSYVVFGDVAGDCAAFARSLRMRGSALSVGDASPSCQLHLMGMLPHLVLSNSSFAWWGAWLGDVDDGGEASRVVVAPDPWWTRPDDIAPERWSRIPHSGLQNVWASPVASSTVDVGVNRQNRISHPFDNPAGMTREP